MARSVPWFNRKYPLKYIKKLIYWPVQYSGPAPALGSVLYYRNGAGIWRKRAFGPATGRAWSIPYGIMEPEDGREVPAGQVEEF